MAVLLCTNSHIKITERSVRPKKINCLFPVTVRKKNRVGRSVIFFLISLFFWSKMCVLCMFYVD